MSLDKKILVNNTVLFLLVLGFAVVLYIVVDDPQFIQYSPPLKPECGDNIDNDGDGIIDFSKNPKGSKGDPDCVSKKDDSEDLPEFTPFIEPECGDKIDNDGDGLIDFAKKPKDNKGDLDCTSKNDDSESPPEPEPPENPYPESDPTPDPILENPLTLPGGGNGLVLIENSELVIAVGVFNPTGETLDENSVSVVLSCLGPEERVFEFGVSPDTQIVPLVNIVSLNGIVGAGQPGDYACELTVGLNGVDDIVEFRKVVFVTVIPEGDEFPDPLNGDPISVPSSSIPLTLPGELLGGFVWEENSNPVLELGVFNPTGEVVLNQNIVSIGMSCAGSNDVSFEFEIPSSVDLSPGVNYIPLYGDVGAGQLGDYACSVDVVLSTGTGSVDLSNEKLYPGTGRVVGNGVEYLADEGDVVLSGMTFVMVGASVGYIDVDTDGDGIEDFLDNDPVDEIEELPLCVIVAVEGIGGGESWYNAIQAEADDHTSRVRETLGSDDAIIVGTTGRVNRYHLANVGNAQERGEDLQIYLKGLSYQYGKRYQVVRILVVAHSLGGISTFNYITQNRNNYDIDIPRNVGIYAYLYDPPYNAPWTFGPIPGFFSTNANEIRWAREHGIESEINFPPGNFDWTNGLDGKDNTPNDGFSDAVNHMKYQEGNAAYYPGVLGSVETWMHFNCLGPHPF